MHILIAMTHQIGHLRGRHHASVIDEPQLLYHIVGVLLWNWDSARFVVGDKGFNLLLTYCDGLVEEGLKVLQHAVLLHLNGFLRFDNGKFKIGNQRRVFPRRSLFVLKDKFAFTGNSQCEQQDADERKKYEREFLHDSKKFV